MEQPRIRECDINPLFATTTDIVALDARIALHSSSDEPICAPAIRPYAWEYVRTVRLLDRTNVTLRPIRLEDEPAIAHFHEGLSEESIRQRYFGLTSLSQRVEHSRLIRVCLNDFDCQMAFVAERTGSNEILAVSRLSRERRSPKAEFSLLVADAWQHRGVGTLLLDHLITMARKEGILTITGTMLAGNSAMLALCRAKGFQDITKGIELIERVALELRQENGDNRCRSAID